MKRPVRTIMKSDIKKFAGIISGIAVLLVILAAYPLFYLYGMKVLIGFLVAIVLTYFKAGVGYYYIDKYFSASLKDFMKAVFGIMGLRLLVLAVLIVLVIGFTKIHKVSFTVSLFISYILFSVIEIYFLNKKASNPET